MNSNKIMKALEVTLYIGGVLMFALSFVGGFIVETYLGMKIYGEIYMTRMLSMVESPAAMAFTALSFGFLTVVIIKHVVKPAVKDILAGIENS